jgi:Tol biopolymer transport system component
VVLIRLLAAFVPAVGVLTLWIVGRWSAWVPAGEIAQMTRERSFEGLPSLSPDGEWIAYRSDATGGGDIYVRRVSGGAPINLTSGSAANETDPAFSPDGASIAFSVERSGISIVPREGGEARRLTPDGCNPAWTPDGRFIVYASECVGAAEFRSSISEGRIVDVATGATKVVTPGDFHAPSVSPDGLRIAYWGRPLDRQNRRRVTSARGHVWTIGIDGSDPVRVTRETAAESSPIWAPDGRYLYYVSNRSGPHAIWRIRIDQRTGRGRGKPVQVPTPPSQPTHLTRSADGRRFAWSDARPIQRAMRIDFDADARTTRGVPTEILPGNVNWEEAEPSPDGSLFLLMSAQGHLHVGSADAPPRPLTSNQVLDWHPRWSPDGQWIAFQSNRGGSYGVWLVRPDGRGLRALPHTVGDASRPVWSPDGEQLAVSDGAAGRCRLVRVGDEAAPSEVLPPVTQGMFAPSDWSPDGRLIAGSVSGTVWFYSLQTRSYEQFRPGTSPVWLKDSRRFIYAYGGRLFMADSYLKISRELLAISDKQLDKPRLSRDNLHLYFSAGGDDANLWVMTLPGWSK